MEDPHSTLEKLNDKGDGLRVDFYWLGDRFGHAISLVSGEESTIVWRSVEDDERCPAFQELHEQTDASGRRMLFLHGAASGAQWSMSVEKAPTEQGLNFDVAARVTSGSLERVIEYLWNNEKSTRINCKTYEETDYTSSENTGRFVPAPRNEAVPVTLRWKYWIGA